jgi:hypothetical protein
MGTELTSALSLEERDILNALKTVQVNVSAKIESQNETVSQLTVERQRLQSLLVDNLLKRRQELFDDQSNEGEEIDRRGSRGKASYAAVLEQRREDLEFRQKELADAIRIANEIESRLAGVRMADISIKAELIEAKNEFENLKLQDMKNSQALEQAHQEADKLLNKVSK